MRKSDKKSMPMILVTCYRTQKNIFDVNEILSIRVIAESQKPRTSVGQCRRCQRFGHAQRHCWATRVRVKCAGNHSSNECRKSENTPATCANCKGGHTASYRGCDCFPKLGRTNKNRTHSEHVPISTPRSRPSGANSQRSGVFYAQAAATTSNNPFSNLTASLQALQDFLRLNPGFQQILSFNVNSTPNA
ncbi:hypothetical protein JTB14_035818 [Gonioctena quinquepunctata]|nr:hypothetical protein JTB14_035818 [Gonioctena quinquepunctata]